MLQSIKKDALFVFILLALTYAYFYQDPGWNGNSRLGLTAAIVREGRLTIDSFNNDTAGFQTGDVARYNKHYYTDKAIGSSVIAAVIYAPIYWLMRFFGQTLSIWAMKYLLTLLVMGIPSALAGSLIYIVCKTISGDKFRSFIVTLAIALGTMCFPFSIVFFGHQLAAALLFFSFFLIFQLKVKTVPAGNGTLFLLGVLLGFALITDFTTAVIVLLLTLYYFTILWTKQGLTRIRAFVLPALGGLIPILIMVAYNLLCYGKPLVSGYEYLRNPFYKEAMSHGILGIGWPNLKVIFYETLHPADGLFWQSPVLLMTIVGAYYMFRQKKYRIEGLIAVIAFFTYLVLNSGYFMWWGGYSFGPRQIIVMLPFLCLPLIFVPRRLFPLVVALTIISIFQMGIVAASDLQVPDTYFQKIDKIGFFQYSAIYSYCLTQLLDGKFAWNLGNAAFGLQNWISLLPITLTIAGSTVLMAVNPHFGENKHESNLGQLSS